MQIQACLIPEPSLLTHTTLMSTRALGMPVPGPWSTDGSEKRELREPVGEQLGVRETHLGHPKGPAPPPALPRPEGHTRGVHASPVAGIWVWVLGPITMTPPAQGPLPPPQA